MVDKPRENIPYPEMTVENIGGYFKISIVISTRCIDEQSHALTHDQLKHLTGRALQAEYSRRRKELEEENHASGH